MHLVPAQVETPATVPTVLPPRYAADNTSKESKILAGAIVPRIRISDRAISADAATASNPAGLSSLTGFAGPIAN